MTPVNESVNGINEQKFPGTGYALHFQIKRELIHEIRLFMTTNDRLTQLWSLLVDSAHAQKVLTDAILGQMIGVPAQAIKCFLRPIQDYCNFHNLPPLTSLVLDEMDGPPAGEFNNAEDLFGERARVYFFDWLSRKSPAPEDLIKVTTKGTNEMTYYSRWHHGLIKAATPK
jgi:hypothetical protein